MTRIKVVQAVGLIAIIAVSVLSGCATAHAPAVAVPRFLDTLNRYPHTNEPLKTRKLSWDAAGQFPQGQSADVFIMVHPGYSLFFRDQKKSRYGAAKYGLVSRQFDAEARFIADAARSGKILILILPGNYETESTAPLSYTTYLNKTASHGENTFHLFSTSASTGDISVNDMVELYQFLQGVNAGKVMIGGGYIGRCQREFYYDLTTYFNRSATYIVPEISTISPDDLSESEAGSVLESITSQNYTPVKKFIDEKLDNNANILSIPQKRQM